MALSSPGLAASVPHRMFEPGQALTLASVSLEIAPQALWAEMPPAGTSG